MVIAFAAVRAVTFRCASPLTVRRLIKLGTALAAAALAVPATRADELDTYIAKAMKAYRIPAVALGVFRDGKLVDARCRGVVNLELGVKAHCAHRFEIGSVSKQFTAYAVLILQERGKVDLDAPLGRYVDGLPAEWAAVQIDHLLTHTSGLPDLESAFTYAVYREKPSDVEFRARLAALPIEFKAGEKFSYSNTNYWLLARVIENVSGQSYDVFMQQNVFEPLRMKATRSSLPTRLLPGRAAGYQQTGGRVENRDATQPNTGKGLGDIVSNLADMARWEREQLKPTLVSPATAERARRPVRLNDGSTAPYGFGLDLEQGALPLATIQHEGQTPGFTAAYLRVPELRLAVVVFANAFVSPVDTLALRALRHVAPSLRNPTPLKEIPDENPEVSRRVLELHESARSASTAWREAWFALAYWSELRPWMNDIADTANLFGPVRRLTLVARKVVGEEREFTYLVDYADLRRVVRIRFDASDRIVGRRAVDE
jgi:CubicO group peptidase (beta-lactamase class C family)